MSDTRLEWMITGILFTILMFYGIPEIVEHHTGTPHPEEVVVDTENVVIPVLLGDVKGRVVTGTLTLSKEDAATFMTRVRGVGTWRVSPPKELDP